MTKLHWFTEVENSENTMNGPQHWENRILHLLHVKGILQEKYDCPANLILQMLHHQPVT